jgi:hypothetical protein
MEPISLPKPDKDEFYDDDKLIGSELDHGSNPQLMEAQFLQLVSSLRALASSNLQLLEALLETPDDVDFLLAVKENKYLILTKRSLLVHLVTDMKRMSIDMDVPDDIRDMAVVVPEQETPYYPPLSTAVLAPVPERSTTNDTTMTQEDAGVYL